MKEYYYLEHKNQKGPFTIEELKIFNLSGETLVWGEGMDNWQKMRDVPELVQYFKSKSIPPPPPVEIEEKIPISEVTKQISVTTEETSKTIQTGIDSSKKAMTWLIIWCSFHLFALLTAYSQIEIFNDSGIPETDKLWPFVNYFSRYYYSYGGHKDVFKGFFVDYDLTEFALYVGGAVIIFILLKIKKNK